MTYETKKNVLFFYKERKRTQKNVPFFYKELKRTQERCVLLKRTDAQPWVMLGLVKGGYVRLGPWSQPNITP